ncbi:MAG TPA: rod shape-determining protein MreC [Treponemataceae bacterium]|nr:rod shape-determining protein MreC [Treponemataceae bacterium]HUH44170.1 rod shape-determining protein MreC [Treponemataceae bacterium]
MDVKTKKRALSPHLIVFVILMVCSSTLLALSTGGFILNFKSIGFSFMSSLQKGTHHLVSSVSDFFNSVKELSVLRKEYEVLTLKLQDYEYLQRNNAEIRKENELLREQLSFSQSLAEKNYPALVIGRDPHAAYSALTIDKGSMHNIKKNMSVIAIQNGDVGLVGKIVMVGLTSSMVMPVYDFQCNISARIQTTRDIGIVNGRGSANSPLLLQYVKNKVIDELQFGDVIVTSGESETYTKDIPIGRIISIKNLDYDNSLEIELDPIIDFSRLETVIVVDLPIRGEW